MRSLPLLLLLACTGPETGESGEADTDTDTDTDVDACSGMAVPMVRVPAGTHTLGSPVEEVGRAPDEEVHEVALTRDLCLGVTAVTQGQFRDIMGDDPSHYAECGDECPVEQVSWHRAAVLANQLSKAEGLGSCYACTGSGDAVVCEPAGDPYACEGYRLPTEAEWEVAARGGEGGSVPGGGSLVAGTGEDCTAGLALDDGSVLQERAWYCASAGGLTHAVGTLAPSGYGLHDVVGQVWEWCHDGYGPYQGSGTDPVGVGERRVNRGGSWSSVPRKLRAAQRDSDLPATVDRNLGLRLARTAP